MTRLPHENRNVKDRPDLPKYELNEFCPVTGEVPEPGSHHIWRRSFGTPSWWVELWDGTIVGNRIRLSPDAHRRITENRARIELHFAQNGRPEFWWVHEHDLTKGQKLSWQPPTHLVPAETPIVPIRDAEHPIAEGEPCPTCKRRVPHAKKPSTPKSKVWSTRVPLDDADAETFSELVDAAAEHHGLTARPYHRYLTILFGVTLLLQAKKGDLPVG